MAHENIAERRKRVANILALGVSFTETLRRQLANEFGCSTTAIRSDVIALTVGSGVHVTPLQRKRVYARDGYICQYCGSADAPNYVVEHIIPASRGGLARLSNLTVACQSCNTTKRDYIWEPRNIDIVTAECPGWLWFVRLLARADIENKQEKALRSFLQNATGQEG